MRGEVEYMQSGRQKTRPNKTVLKRRARRVCVFFPPIVSDSKEKTYDFKIYNKKIINRKMKIENEDELGIRNTLKILHQHDRECNTSDYVKYMYT